MKTAAINPKKVNIEWHLIDAKGQVLGRVASRIAQILSGKNKVEFSPNQVISDRVVVINAAQVKVTGNKAQDKIYYTHSNFPGGLKSASFEQRMAKHPTKVLVEAFDAVQGAFKVLGWIASAAKPIIYIGSLIAAAGIAWQTFIKK